MSEWFQKWFSSDEYLTVYSHRNEEDAENIINLILDEFPLKKDTLILDAACGAGRHSIILAEKFKVTAFDLSKNLLMMGKSNATELGVKVDFVCADMRCIHFTTRFDLVLNMFTSFGYFNSDQENFAFFKNATNFIAPGGILVLDYLNKSQLKKSLVPVSFKEIGNKKVIETRSIVNDVVIKKIKIHNGKNISEYNESVKLYEYGHIVSEFNKLGFTVEKVFGDYKGEEYKKDDSERTIICFKYNRNSN